METATLLTLRIPAFDAAVRKAAEPRLASRPVAVVTSFRAQGRVVAACPAAAAAGIEEGMLYSAARLACSDAAFFIPDKRLAEQVFGEVWKRAAAYSPQIEAAGNGCVLLDTRGTERLLGSGLQVAEKAQRDIRDALRLPIAAGLAARRPWSLLASRAAGDCGIRQIAPGSEDDFLNQVPVAWIDGITAKTRVRLMEMNILMTGQLRQFGRDHIIRQFGTGCGDVLWGILHPQPWRVGGAGQACVDVAEDAIKAEAFLPEASVEAEKVRLAAETLARQVAAVLRQRCLGAARLRLMVLHVDGVVKNDFLATGGFIQDEAVLVGLATQLLQRIFKRRVRINRLWLAAEKLAAPERQKVLFSTVADDGAPAPRAEQGKADALLHTLDRIRARYGGGMVQSGALALGTASGLSQTLRGSPLNFGDIV